MSLVTPTYGTVAIFGRSPKLKTTNDPSAEQLNAFFGLDGTERLHGGLQGRVTLASGLLFGTNAAFLGAARESFRALDDGQARTLVDTLGASWPFVLLRQFDVGDKILRDTRGLFLPYRAVFRHLA